MISLVIGILVTIVLGAILFWVIDRFVRRAARKASQVPRHFDLSGFDREPLASPARLSLPSVSMILVMGTLSPPRFSAYHWVACFPLWADCYRWRRSLIKNQSVSIRHFLEGGFASGYIGSAAEYRAKSHSV